MQFCTAITLASMVRLIFNVLNLTSLNIEMSSSDI